VITKTDDDSNTHFSDRYQQTYHSTFGARSECSHVFLHGAGVHDRLCAKHPTRILEIGFGLGLNCLLCADCATTLPPDSPTAAQGLLGKYCELTLYSDDATSPTLLKQLESSPGFNAIFLDAFSPDVNPECWTQPFLSQLRLLLAPGGRLATYCVKGSVRRNLISAGFSVNKYPGPTGKREVLWASHRRSK